MSEHRWIYGREALCSMTRTMIEELLSLWE